MYIIFDLEATCCNRGRMKVSEIIEIGAVKLNDNLEVVDEFQRFIKPIKHPHLYPFCLQLTGIKQEDINKADKFPTVNFEFLHWIKKDSLDYVIYSWGGYDKKKYVEDCDLHGLKCDWVGNHVNFKKVFSSHVGIKQLGVESALKVIGKRFDGSPHRGIDDARNIARIFKHYKNNGEYDKEAKINEIRKSAKKRKKVPVGKRLK